MRKFNSTLLLVIAMLCIGANSALAQEYTLCVTDENENEIYNETVELDTDVEIELEACKTYSVSIQGLEEKTGFIKTYDEYGSSVESESWDLSHKTEFDSSKYGKFIFRISENPDYNVSSQREYCITITPLCKVTINAEHGTVIAISYLSGEEIDLSTDVLIGTELYLRPVNDDGYTFDHWKLYVDSYENIENNSELSIGILNDMEITAVFVPLTYIIDVTNDNNCTVAVAVDGDSGADLYNVPSGSEITVTVTPNEGYHIDDENTSIGVSEYKRDNNVYTFTMPEENIDIKIECVNGEIEALQQLSDITLVDDATLISPDFGDIDAINTAIGQVANISPSSADDVSDFLASDYATTLRAYKTALDTYGSPMSVTYTMKADRYGTIILPFNWTKPENWMVYSCNGTEGEEDSKVVSLTPVDNPQKNTPYIVKTSNGENETFQFVGGDNEAKTSTQSDGILYGVLEDEGATIPNGSYVLATNKSEGTQAFYLTDGSVTCPQYKCYLTLAAGSEAKVINIVVEEEADGIKAVNSEQLTVINGKFIENGRVVIVKNGKKFNLNGQEVK